MVVFSALNLVVFVICGNSLCYPVNWNLAFKTQELDKIWLVNFNSGKIWHVSFDCSVKSDPIYMEMNWSVLDEKFAIKNFTKTNL